jgi:anthranilate phosphoribosyltransferase
MTVHATPRAAAAPRDILRDLANGAHFDALRFRDALEILSSAAATPQQQAAFLALLRGRGETVAEITGAATLLRETMLRVSAPPDTIDIVGTGGDGHGTVNVSTCAAFVAAGAGVTVAKHGNRAVSSKSGASDVLAALGVTLDAPLPVVERAIREAKVGFLWAPLYHPLMKVWAPVRAELGFRSIFNLLGPICNPAGVTRQVVGVFDHVWLSPVAEVLRNLGSHHAIVVHGADGMDELTTTGITNGAVLKGGQVRALRVTPEEAGLPRAQLADLAGGDAAQNAVALRAVLAGQPGAYRDIVLLNAAAALMVADKASTLAEGAALAAQSIDSGAAARALEALVEITAARS